MSIVALYFLYHRGSVDMKSKKIVQTRFIDGSDGHDTAAEFNQTMIELADLNPRFERDGHSFWIFYSVEINEPENLIEEHEMNGESHRCIECPFLIRDLNRFGNPDVTHKHGTCGKSGQRVRIDGYVCETYYKERG